LNSLILIPTLAFVALHFVKIHPLRGGLRRAIAVWAVLFVAAALILAHFPAALFYPKNEALQSMQSELYRLAVKPLKKDEVVVLIQGSSAVAACVKPRLLERLLREKNLPARVFVLSVAGSNHFERLELLRQWLAQLTPAQAQAFRKARVVLLREVLLSYDENPLNGFVENAFGDRSIAYTTPANAIPMLRTAWAESRADDSSDAPAPTLAPLIVGHLLFNVFRVGTIPSVQVAKAAYSNHGAAAAARQTTAPRAAAFDYAGAVGEYREQMARTKAAKPIPTAFSWQPIHDRELLRVTGGEVDAVGYLTTPHISPNPRRYEKKHLDALDVGTVRFDGGSDAVLALLDQPQYWRDHVHLTPAGGEVYTRWLADQLAAAWPQISGETVPKKSD
jgi:hypothetical protein